MRGAGEASAEERLRASLAERGFALRVVDSGSMMPVIRPGDTVLIRPLSACRTGQVVVVARGDRLVTHRVVRVTGGTVVCRGDSLVHADPPVPVDRVLGEVVEVVGRGPLPVEPWRVRFARARAVTARFVRLTARLPLELLLLTRQLRGATPGHGVLEQAGFDLPEDVEDVWVVGAAEAAASGHSPLAAASAARSIIVPAGIYSRFPAVGRRELLERLAGSRAEVWAYAMPTAGRVVRFTAGLRIVLGALSLSAGEPGDGYLAPLDGLGRGFIHYFREEELRRELAATGIGPAVVEVRRHGHLLKGSVKL